MKKLVKLHTKFSSLCFTLGKSRIGVRAPPLKSNPAYNSIHKADRKTSDLYGMPRTEQGDTNTKTKTKTSQGNRIMVVVDSTKEAKDALQWALTHAVQKEDTLILMHIANPKTKGPYSKSEVNPRAYELLYSLKSVCETKKPGVEVEFAVLKGKEKGKVIVEEAKLQKATLLILGHRRRCVMWRLLKRWRKNKQSSNAIANYCIQNASCMTIVVRRKSKKLGGYLVTTKRHTNFWLLA